MSADIKELQLLAKRLNIAVKKVPKVMDEILQDAGKTFIRVAKQNTPVDTGNLRRNWTPENNRIEGSQTRELTIVNPVEYAEYVNYGHRTPGGTGFVEGYHMAEKAEKQAQRELDKAGPKRLDKMLRETWEGK